MGIYNNEIHQLNSNIDKDFELLQGQSEVYKLLFAYADSLVLRSAVELRIADIIHSHGQPMSLPQLASKIESRSLDVGGLARVLRMLVRKKILNVEYKIQGENNEQVLYYSLTTTSKFLLHDHDYTLAPVFLTWTHPWVVQPWFEISGSIKDGGAPFVKAHGESCWEMASKNVEFNKMFNSGMAAATKPILDAIIKGYNDGFSKLEGRLVDVGGGVGKLVTKIVEAHPHIKGINFDLPHVVANAPQYPGVTHVGGDIFKEIPCADNVIIKSVLVNWTDEDCARILKNCKEAVSKSKGKVIIVDIILHPNRHEMFDDVNIALDFLMMTNCIGGKERTENEWKKLLKQVGFTYINIVPLQAMMSLIEAIP